QAKRCAARRGRGLLAVRRGCPTTCPCRACASVGALTLKLVVHSGSWVRQRVAGNDHFVGDDLVLAHRLLKNSVPSHEYILLTDVALRALGTEGATPHEEHVEHHGVIRCGYIDLSELRIRALTERTDHLDRGEAQWLDERELPVSIARARDVVRQDALVGWRGEHFQLLEGPASSGDQGAAGSRTSGVDAAHPL